MSPRLTEEERIIKLLVQKINRQKNKEKKRQARLGNENIDPRLSSLQSRPHKPADNKKKAVRIKLSSDPIPPPKDTCKAIQTTFTEDDNLIDDSDCNKAVQTSIFNANLSLQEALSNRKPDFISKSAQRVKNIKRV